MTCIRSRGDVRNFKCHKGDSRGNLVRTPTFHCGLGKRERITYSELVNGKTESVLQSVVERLG